MATKPGSAAKSDRLAKLIILTLIVVFLYLMARTTLFIIADYRWYEKILAFLLLAAEAFVLVHSIGYFLNVYRVVNKSNSSIAIKGTVAELTSYPPVAIIVSSFKEPLEVIEDTLTCFYNITYPNKHLYFLDDTRYDVGWDSEEEMLAYRASIEKLCESIGVNLFRRTWRGAKAGMINDFLNFIEGHPREGFAFWPFQQKEKPEKEKYIVVFDADMNAFPHMIEPLVAWMESDERLAFVQTPQYYSNFEFNRVARAAGLQQAIFYEYICEGKSIEDAMFCCGTNVIFRREALLDVGGFDESSVTEDFATSLRFHLRHWHSAYLNKVLAFGMGPEDLGSYFKQQFRWALGTVGLFRSIVREFLRQPSSLPLAKWWEYFLSGSHYFVGWVFFIMAICPVLYLYFKVPSFFARPDIYLLFFFPYIMLSLSMFFGTLRQRGYRPKELFRGLLLNGITFPVYMRASFLAMIGVRGTFGITPKGGSRALPLRRLWPQLGTALLCFGALVWGLNRLYYEREPVAAILMNCFWCLYHFLILSTVIYFNHPLEEK